MSWLQTLTLHSYSIREENLSDGLAVLGQSSSVVNGMDHVDGVSALASVSPLVEEGQDVACNGNSNEHPSQNVSSV